MKVVMVVMMMMLKVMMKVVMVVMMMMLKVGDESVGDIATCSKLRMLDIQVCRLQRHHNRDQKHHGFCNYHIMIICLTIPQYITGYRNVLHHTFHHNPIHGRAPRSQGTACWRSLANVLNFPG